MIAIDLDLALFGKGLDSDELECLLWNATNAFHMLS